MERGESRSGDPNRGMSRSSGTVSASEWLRTIGMGKRGLTITLSREQHTELELLRLDLPSGKLEYELRRRYEVRLSRTSGENSQARIEVREIYCKSKIGLLKIPKTVYRMVRRRPAEILFYMLFCGLSGNRVGELL